MTAPLPPPRCVAVAANPRSAEAVAESHAVVQFLTERGLCCAAQGPLHSAELRETVTQRAADVLIALGGDGTMLRAGHLCAPVGVPILGINMGRFGFLTEIHRDQWREQLSRMLDGNYRLERRMMLRADHLREGQVVNSWDVMNEVMVCRGALVRPIQVQASVDGYPLASYVADGLIASTPTGSTAYALAAGGPIMPPELHNILIIAVAPHLSLDRAIILSEGASVLITPHCDHQAVVSVDGQYPEPLQEGDSVRVEAGDKPVTFIRFHDPGYFYRNLTLYMEQNPILGNLR